MFFNVLKAVYMEEMVNAAVGFYRQITRGLPIATYLSKPFPKQALGFTCLQYKSFNPFPNDKIIESSELKQFADDSFKFYKNGRQSSKRVENTVKRWNCLLRAISPFPTVFKRFVLHTRKNQELFGKGSKTLWKTKKLVVTSSFSFLRIVFYPFGKLSTIFIKKIVVCKLFLFGRRIWTLVRRMMSSMSIDRETCLETDRQTYRQIGGFKKEERHFPIFF